ncbi:Putative mitochondrial cysteine synthase [Brettanomyces nanus]|uniref:cysteine synthase n=1 Tax=Eeniella nana TaxID=13502 RepID=A0A875S2W0_EENNA|nr:Putative mitochondrial cysteine synthase [Brettanomyces nanus]QPG74402.1 Putative mitochondrial cysteine synthase [Brettanomyces nanus]
MDGKYQYLTLIVGTVVTTYSVLRCLGYSRRSCLLPERKECIADLIGNTPMMKIRSLSKLTGCEIYAKLEMANPGGSAKDRTALAIIREYEDEGKLVPGRGDVVFEGTSGSTGISFAMLCNALGYTAHICVQSDTSAEKIALLESYGADVEKVKPASIVDPEQYVNAARAGAEALSADTTQANGVFADQFENDVNWRIHYETTGPEIYEQMNHDLDYFITGSGTGGTIAGIARYLKEQNPNISIILADPQGSGMFNRVRHGVMYDTVEKEGTRRRHQVDTIVEGIGLNRVTHNFLEGEDCIDDSQRVTDEQALKMARFLSSNDGLFVGASSSINAVAAARTALKARKGSKIVIIGCDSGARHLSKFWKEALKVDRHVSLEEILGNDKLIDNIIH